MSKILVAEDDDYFRMAIVQFLSSKGHTVIEAPNGKVAREILPASDVEIILCDVQMPFLDGVELLTWVKEHKPTPFILMTGFTNLLETQTAFDLGADDFLAKPFKNEELLKAVKNILDKKFNKNQNEDSGSVDHLYCKVSIEEFVSRNHIEFDVYVKLSAKKFVKIGHKGDPIPTDRIKQYQSKGVKFLHILKEDFNLLVNFNMQLMGAIKKTSTITKEKKLQFTKYTGELILERAFVSDVDAESFREAKDFLTNSLNVVAEEDEEAFQLIDVLNHHSDFVYAHSLGVSMYSVLIAKKMGFTSSQILFKLGLAGIFHDIGKKEIPVEILSKSRLLMTQKERAQYETHATRGRDILLSLRGMPSDVTQMVYEHHEDCQGQGYPQGLTRKEMHPLSKILIVANLFCEHALKSPSNPGLSAQAAIKHIENIYLDRLDSAAMSGLKQLFPAQ